MNQQAVAESIEELQITNVEADDDGLKLSWSDNQSSYFHYVWLRDCCYCETCGDSYSSKRYVLPADIPLDVNPASTGLDQGNLKITWKHDGHISHYSAGWLSRYRYDAPARETRFHQPTLWHSNLTTRIPQVGYQSAVSHERHQLDLYRKLRDYGFVLVTGGPPEAGGIEKVAGLIGEMGESAYTRIFDLSPSSAINTLGNTHSPVPPHTDEAFRHNPPGINVLGCVRPAKSGGESVLVDGFAIAAKLRDDNPQGFELLARYGQAFNRIHPGELDQRSRQPMIRLDDRGEVVAVRIHTRASAPMDLPSQIVKPFYAAYHHLTRLMLDPNHQVKFQLQAGESVMFDNQRVLHSRTEFSDPQRFLQICNVSRDGFHEKLRLLAAKHGYIGEADMILEY
ncbi:MAG: TauD/TfdA family dioxygenase [Pseudomonadota bacterium]